MNFPLVAGQATANFGPGISVGGAAPGTFGPLEFEEQCMEGCLYIPVARLTVAADAAVGPRSVQIRNPQGTVTVADPVQVSAGRINYVSPPSATPGAALTVNIIGEFTSWATGQTTLSLGPGITVGSGAEGGFGNVTVLSPSEIQASIRVAPTAALGVRTVRVRTGTSETSADSFMVVPELLSVTPNVLTAGQNSEVTITGRFTNFPANGTRVSFQDSRVAVGTPPNYEGTATVVNATTIRITGFGVEPSAAGDAAVDGELRRRR